MRIKQSSFFYKNSLSIVLLFIMLCILAAQYVTGWKNFNEERNEHGLADIGFFTYASSGHFIEATFENWESEFLQMALYVLLTVSLRQKGSAESKKIGEEEDVDREPVAHPGAPWPVRKGGWWLKIYNNSLSLAFGLLFLLSFILHFYGSMKEYNFDQQLKHKPMVSVGEFIGNSKFWFESFQNWQSEFLAVFTLVVFTIWFRQKGSAQSKPVDSTYEETGK
jgi:hypothetical protein